MIDAEKLARAWAIADGKEGDFLRAKRDAEFEDRTGYFAGYLAEAGHLLEAPEVRELNVDAIATAMSRMDGLSAPTAVHQRKATIIADYCRKS